MSTTELYWQQAVDRLPELYEYGYIKLDPLPLDIKVKYSEKIKMEMCNVTFKELGDAHRCMLNEIGVHEYLVPNLYAFARKHFSYKGSLENQYHVARFIRPEDSVEAYRTHFDSHLFTLVVPICIPEIRKIEESGALYFLPKARSSQNNEVINLLEKIYFKRYSGRTGQKALSVHDRYRVESFYDMSPLLFLGTTTLHGNFPLTLSGTSSRLTALSHLFDPSARFGVGQILRALRSR